MHRLQARRSCRMSLPRTATRHPLLRFVAGMLAATTIYYVGKVVRMIFPLRLPVRSSHSASSRNQPTSSALDNQRSESIQRMQQGGESLGMTLPSLLCVENAGRNLGRADSPIPQEEGRNSIMASERTGCSICDGAPFLRGDEGVVGTVKSLCPTHAESVRHWFVKIDSKLMLAVVPCPRTAGHSPVLLNFGPIRTNEDFLIPCLTPIIGMTCPCAENLTSEEAEALASSGRQAADLPPLSRGMLGVMHIVFEPPERIRRA